MANFGDNMRELANSKEKKQKEIVKRKLNRSTRSLINNTPIGQIRFKSISFYNVQRRLFRTPRPPYAFVDRRITEIVNEYFLAFDCSKNIDPLTYDCKALYSPQHILSYMLEIPVALLSGVLNLDIPPLWIVPPVGYSSITVVYANNPQSNPNCAKDFISYCFESSILPMFRYSLKRKIKLDKTVKSFTRGFSYEAILTTLEFYNIPISDDDVKTIFTELCEKNGIMLIRDRYPDEKLLFLKLSL